MGNSVSSSNPCDAQLFGAGLGRIALVVLGFAMQLADLIRRPDHVFRQLNGALALNRRKPRHDRVDEAGVANPHPPEDWRAVVWTADIGVRRSAAERALARDARRSDSRVQRRPVLVMQTREDYLDSKATGPADGPLRPAS